MDLRGPLAFATFAFLVTLAVAPSPNALWPVGLHHLDSTQVMPGLGHGVGDAAEGGPALWREVFCVQRVDASYGRDLLRLRLDGEGVNATWDGGVGLRRGNVFVLQEPLRPGSHTLTLWHDDEVLGVLDFQTGAGDGDEASCGYDATPPVTVS